MHGKTRYPRRKMTRAKDNNNATILSIGISKGRIAYQKLIGSRHVKATVPTATSHWANSQACCMQDERLCLPLTRRGDVTVCPSNWPTDYSLLWEWHLKYRLFQFADMLWVILSGHVLYQSRNMVFRCHSARTLENARFP